MTPLILASILMSDDFRPSPCTFSPFNRRVPVGINSTVRASLASIAVLVLVDHRHHHIDGVSLPSPTWSCGYVGLPLVQLGHHDDLDRRQFVDRSFPMIDGQCLLSGVAFPARARIQGERDRVFDTVPVGPAHFESTMSFSPPSSVPSSTRRSNRDSAPSDEAGSSQRRHRSCAVNVTDVVSVLRHSP